MRFVHSKLLLLSSVLWVKHCQAFTTSDDSGYCYGDPDEIGDGICQFYTNSNLNRATCEWDGGDCCEDTCAATGNESCGSQGYYCLDPSSSTQTSYPECQEVGQVGTWIGDGQCDNFAGFSDDYYTENGGNNIEECGWDGGDCCWCDCNEGFGGDCSDAIVDTCLDTSSTCYGVDKPTPVPKPAPTPTPTSEDDGDLVEAAMKTTVTVAANGFDERPGGESGDVGCGADGCMPELARDVVIDVAESRWSCKENIVEPENDNCEIKFIFEEAQDIKQLQVALYRGDTRSRKLKLSVNGDVVDTLESGDTSGYITYDIDEAGVETLILESIGLNKEEWISILEVRFFVAA